MELLSYDIMAYFDGRWRYVAFGVNTREAILERAEQYHLSTGFPTQAVISIDELIYDSSNKR